MEWYFAQPPAQPPAMAPVQRPAQPSAQPPAQPSTRGPSAAQTQPKEVVVLGDSTTKDLSGYLMTKMTKHRAKITNHSLSGCNTDEIGILSQTLCLRKPDILVLHCGTNDLYPKSGRDTEATIYVAKSEDQFYF